MALLAVSQPCSAEFQVPPIDEVVARVKKVYAKKCCFKAKFDQVTVNVAMDMRDRFRGTMFVKKPGLIALDVAWPEIQKVVIRGRAYTVYFPADGNSVKGEIPPEVNLEHFFGFFADIHNLDRNFTISFPPKSYVPTDRLIMVELLDRKKSKAAFRIVLGIDADRYTIRRAIVYDALGNYNRFDLTEIQLLNAIPDSRFIINYRPNKSKDPIRIPFFQEREIK
jgi:outer membrane lipoprotein-sorting protein